VTESIIRDLGRVSLLAGLSAGALERIARVSHARTYGPGETIIFEGDPCEAVFFIVLGQVRVYRLSPGGREQVLARLGSGQSFNTVPPFKAAGVNHASVEALVDTKVLLIGCDDFRHLVGECQELAFVILEDFAGRLDHLTSLVEDLSLRTVRGRLARFLLEHVDQGGTTRRWTQEEMAAHLGTVRDMIGRTLRAFVDAGLVQMERQRIVLLDREGLEAETER
jgi:CRP/FNR family transcriptional regulator